MTSRKITVICHHFHIDMHYADIIGFGFYEWKKAEPQEMENAALSAFLDHLNEVYCKELSRVVKKDGLVLSQNLTDGIDVVDGCWATRTFAINIQPLYELAVIRNEACKGPKTPDWKLCDKQARALARRHWKERDRWPVERITTIA